MAALPVAALDDMDNWTEAQVRARLEDVLPPLLATLNTDSTEHRLRCLRFLLVRCLPHVEPAHADSVLLRRALGVATRTFDEILSIASADSINDNNDNHLTSLLQVAMELVSCVAAVAHYITRAQLPGAFPSAANSGLRVISCAVTLSKSNLERGAQLLRKTSVTLQSLLAALGDDPVSVDNNTELVAHAQLCAQLGVQLEGLDVASMAHAWKSFGKLAQRHATLLRGSFDVSTPVKHLALSVCSTLANLRVLREADKSASSMIKVAGFLLKLVIRLCEEFRGVLGDCHSSLLDLLAALATPRLACPVEADAARHFDVGIGPLLAATLDDVQLVEEFRQRTHSLSENDPQALEGVLHLSALVSLACARNSNLRVLWQDLALDAVLSLVDRAPTASRQSYELLVTYVGALTLTSTPADLSLIEGKLLSMCATPRPLAAILAMDVLVLTARVAQPRFVAAQVALLAVMLAVMPQSQGQRCMKSLVARLFRTLPDSERYRLLKRFPVDQHLGFWEAVGVSSLPNRLLPGVVETLKLLGGPPQQAEAAMRVLKTIEDSIEELSTTKLSPEASREAAKLGRRLLEMGGPKNGRL